MEVARLTELMASPPTFSAKRLLIWVTGSVNAAMVPYWLNWLRQYYPDVTTSVMVTAMAERFVTLDALSHMVTGHVRRDSWDDDRLPRAPHIELEHENDCFGVFPATLDSAMRLASGAASSPTLMVLQATSKPVVIASAFPARNEVIEAQLAVLRRRRNVALCEEIPAFSVGRQSWSGNSGFFLPLLLETLERKLQDRGSSAAVSSVGEPGDGSGDDGGAAER